MLSAVFVLTSLICICTIPVFYSCSVIIIDQQPTCIYYGYSTNTTDIYFLCLWLICYTVLPLVFITVLNVLLIRQIRFQKAKSQVQNFKPKSIANNSSLIAIMVCACVVFAVFSLTAAILDIVNWPCKFTKASHCINTEGWLFSLALMLDNINHSINFFLYCLTGSVFRRALFQLFECKNLKHSEGHLPKQRSIEQNVVSNVRKHCNSRV